MREALEKVVKDLANKASNAECGVEAMQYAQGALNAVMALNALK